MTILVGTASWTDKSLIDSGKFNYDYADAELEEIAGNIKKLSESVPIVHAVMNNNYQDQGQRNARTLAQFLR